MKKTEIKQTLIEKVNKSEWWHAVPRDPDSYKKRGKFLASTFRQAEFYGRPNDIPERVSIVNPVYGFSEREILKKLFPEEYKTLESGVLGESEDRYERRIGLDAKMFRKAKSLGYDAIVLIGSNGRAYLEKNKKPYSIELNLL